MAASRYKWLNILLVFASMGFTNQKAVTANVSSIGHPFYVSVTEFNFNEKEKLMEITSKVFLDDLEKALKNQTNNTVELTNPAVPKKAQEMVGAYFKKRLQLKLDDKSTQLEFVGYEKEAASVWVYFQVSDVSSVKKIAVTNTILYEMYTTQISIMHAQVGNNKKSTRITNPETNAGFEF
jgi:hypothetical protein